MNFSYGQPLMTAPNQQYIQAMTLLALQQKQQMQQKYQLQQKLQLQQQLLLENMLRQNLLNAGGNFKRILTTQPVLQLQRPSIIATNLKVEEATAFSLNTLAAPKTEAKTPSTQTLSRKDIRPLVTYLLNNIGTSKEKELSEFRALYASDHLLSALIDILMRRYTSSQKTKEEMVKYTLRKALRWLRNKVAKTADTDPKKGGMKVLIQKYFGEDLKDKEGFENLDDDEIVEKFLPFKKDSKIKTMNTTFVAELFKSKEFAKEYQEFLKGFSNIMVVDNNRKIEKFISFLENCYSNGSFEKLKNYKRIPWLNAWITGTLTQAKEMPKLAESRKEKPILKAEATGSEEYEPGFEKKVKIEFVDKESETVSTLSPQLNEETSSRC